MAISKASLEAAISASGGTYKEADEVEGLLAKLKMLEATGRYALLLSNIVGANDKSNFHSLVLEASFAHQFESHGINLEYEVKQCSVDGSSIDFAMKLDDGRSAFIELRLLQQDLKTATCISEQLVELGVFAFSKDGDEEKREILRVQTTVLSKVQDEKGNPKKFFRTDASAINIVAVCISDLFLGSADHYDCVLAMYGDSEVPEQYRRGVFGLFEGISAEHTPAVQTVASRFAHLKATVHAVLFLFRASGSSVLNYSLQQVLIWNRALIAEDLARPVAERIHSAIPTLPPS